MPTEPPPPWLLQQRREVGRLVRQARENSGLTQEQLAHATDLDRKTVNRTEMGAPYGVSIDVLLRIAHVLQVPPNQLMPGE